MYDLQTARQAAQQRNERPPGGEQPGTPAYDTWVMNWFEAGLNAGDPDLVRRAGGGQAEEAEGGIADFSGAAPSSEWLGKRKPTPRELRRYARDSGQSEDFQRFDDRQLAAWIGKSWDVQQGAFFNDFGDRVEKPTEAGPKALAAGSSIGERGGGGGMGGGGGRTGQPAQPAPGAGAYQSLEDPLQAALYQLVQSRGMQGQQGITGAQSLAGGGVLSWGQPQPGQPAAPPPGTPGSSTTFGTAPGVTGPGKGGPGGDFNRPSGPFTPGAPGAGIMPGAPGMAAPGGKAGPGFTGGGPVTNAAGNPWAAWAGPANRQPAMPGVVAPAAAPGSFDASLINKFRGRNPAQQWWMR